MKHRLRYIILILALFVPLAAGMIQPGHAAAGASDSAPPAQSVSQGTQLIKNGNFSWYDRNTIHADINGKTYYFRPISVGGTFSTASLEYEVGNSTCWGRLSFDSPQPFNILNGDGSGSNNGFRPNEVAPKSINVDMDWIPSNVGGGTGNAQCQGTSPNVLNNVHISDPNHAFDTYFIVSNGGRTITSVDGSRTYTQDGQFANLFYRDGESTCQDVLKVNKSNGTYQSYELDSNGSGPAAPSSIHSDPGCNLIGGSGLVKMQVDQTLGNAGALQDNPNPNAPGADGGAGGGGSGSLGCDLGISFSPGGALNAINPLNWLFCGVILGMNSLVNSLDSQITAMLSIGTNGTSDDPNQIFATSSGNCGASNPDICGSYQSAWASFRDIALGLLVIVGLIIVISQALGMEILDAYTIRKMLPRVLIATLAITLSWQLMRFAVTLSNDLGYGVYQLIHYPFRNLPQVNIQTSNLFASLAIATGAIVFDLFGLLAFAGTAALAVLITFLVLILRQIAVIILIILSPIAIIAYVLPNTVRFYKFWWESFSKMLLMFPMIIAFITAGHIFSAIAGNKGSDFANQTIAFLAYFAPYFAIPLTFRFSGAIMGGIGNAVNQRGEGARGVLRNFRANRAKQNLGDLAAGRRLNQDTLPRTYGRFARRFNQATGGVANTRNAGYNPLHMRSRMQRGSSERVFSEAMKGLEENPEFKGMTDDLYEAGFSKLESRPGSGIHGGQTDGEVRAFLADRGFQGRDLEEGVATARAARHTMSPQAFKFASVVGNSKTGTGFQKAAGGAGALNAAIIEAGGDSRWLRTQGLIQARTGMGQERRLDSMGGSFTKHEALSNEQAHGRVTREQATEQLHRNALEGQSGGALLSARRQSQEATFPVMRQVMDEAVASHDSRRILQEVAINASRHDVAGQVSPEAGKLFADTVLSHNVNIRDLPPEITQVASGYLSKLPEGQSTITYGELRDAVSHDDEYREMHREWGDKLDAERRAAEAAAGQGAQGTPGGIPEL